MEKIYLDYAATAPCDPRVFKAMEPFYFEHFGNSSSPHTIGRNAQAAVEESREKIAKFINVLPEEIVFNSGTTEGNNHVITSIAKSLKHKGNHILISAIEHHSVLEPAEHLSKEGFIVHRLPVDPNGMININEVKNHITDSTILICVMHANNEIGTIQPIKEISAIASKHKIPFLVDAAQTLGHIPVDVKELGADFLTFSAHKFYGPKGVGGLFIRKGINLPSFFLGGDQERSRRASTLNVPGIVGLGKAIEYCAQMNEEAQAQSKLRDSIIEGVLNNIKGAHLNGENHTRLPNNAHFSFEGVSGEALLMSLDMENICASMGSACTSGAMEASHVLRAIGLSDELAFGSLRISIGRWTKPDHVDILLDKLPKIVERLRI